MASSLVCTHDIQGWPETIAFSTYTTATQRPVYRLVWSPDITSDWGNWAPGKRSQMTLFLLNLLQIKMRLTPTQHWWMGTRLGLPVALKDLLQPASLARAIASVAFVVVTSMAMKMATTKRWQRAKHHGCNRPFNCGIKIQQGSPAYDICMLLEGGCRFLPSVLDPSGLLLILAQW